MLLLIYCVSVSRVAHHDSRTSTFPAFLAGVHPELAVICLGKDNPFGHPHREVVDRPTDRLGEDNIHPTDQDGTIEFITDGETLWVENGQLGTSSISWVSATVDSLP